MHSSIIDAEGYRFGKSLIQLRFHKIWILRRHSFVDWNGKDKAKFWILVSLIYISLGPCFIFQFKSVNQIECEPHSNFHLKRNLYVWINYLIRQDFVQMYLCAVSSKVILHKSRGKVSLVKQDTIECVSIAYIFRI